MKAPIRISRPRGLKVPRPRGWQDWALAAACLVVIVVAVTAVGSSAAGTASSSTRTAEVGKGVVQATVSGNGSLEPAKQVELSFGASGEVTAIYVKAGEQVVKGQILARVDASSARASLAAARAQLSEAEETLEAAEEAEEESETEEAAYRGTYGVATALVSYVADTTTPETTSAEGEGEAAAEGGSEEEGSEEGESKQQGGTSEGSSKEQSGSQQSGSGGSGSGSGSKEEAKSESEGGENGEPSTAAEGSSSGGGEEGVAAGGGGATVSVATAEAQVKEARLSVRSAEREVRETTLRAPFKGTVASLSGSVGETVSGGESSGGSSPGGESSGGSSSSFIVLSQISKLKMEIAFSEADIGKVEVGQIATVSVSSTEGTELAGRVTKVDVLPSEGSTGVVEYPATILLTQNAEGVRAGMSASAEVVVEQVSNAVTVPSEAINSGPSKTVTVSEDGKEVTKTVKTGLVGDENTEIISGLKAGETVVLPEATVTAASSSGGEKSESSSGFPGGGFSGGGGPPGGAGGGPPGFGGG